MSYYSDETLDELREAEPDTARALREMVDRLLARSFQDHLSARAIEYLRHGVCRRLQTLERCMRRVFRIFPAERTALLDAEERALVEVSIQAFLLNLYGVMDNAAWVLLFERQVDLPRKKVGLFQEATQAHLPLRLVELLSTFRAWHDDYVKNYRDALAHRIPLYVPPQGLSEADASQYRDLETQIGAAFAKHNVEEASRLLQQQSLLGIALPVYGHSTAEALRPATAAASRGVFIHPQMIADARTVTAILDAAFPATPDAADRTLAGKDR